MISHVVGKHKKSTLIFESAFLFIYLLINNTVR